MPHPSSRLLTTRHAALALIVCALLPFFAGEASAAAVTKASDWVANGEANLAAGKPSDALYCFYMASFQEPDDPKIAALVDRAKGEVRNRERTPYVIPREPQNFHYILFRTQTESTMEDTDEGGEVFVRLRDGSRVNVASYINRLRSRGRREDGEATDGKIVVRRGSTGEKVIALTFDDGPNPSITPKLLDLLGRNGVKATFFVVGRNVRAYPNLVKRIAREGHLLANHSDSHPNMARLSEARIRKELDAVDAALAGCGVETPVYFRPPYGAMGKSLIDVCRDSGRTVVLWSIDTNDWRHPSASKMLRHILNNARPGDVVLMHDIHPQCLDVVEPLVEAMHGAGYRFVLLDELFGAGGSRPLAASRPAAESAEPPAPAATGLAAVPAAVSDTPPAALPARIQAGNAADVLRFVRRATGTLRAPAPAGDAAR